MINSSKHHRSTRRNNSLHPGYLTSLVTRTNHSTIQTNGIYVRVFRTADHAGQIFIPHRIRPPPPPLFIPSLYDYMPTSVFAKATPSKLFRSSVTNCTPTSLLKM